MWVKGIFKNSFDMWYNTSRYFLFSSRKLLSSFGSVVALPFFFFFFVMPIFYLSTSLPETQDMFATHSFMCM